MERDAQPPAWAALQEAPSAEALMQVMTTKAAAYGLRFFALAQHGTPAAAKSGFLMTTFPSAWIARYQAQRYAENDPVAAACRTVARGFLWSELPSLIALTDHQAAIMNEARRFGLGEGYTVPIHVPGERLGSCSWVARVGTGIAPDIQPELAYGGGVAFERARQLLREDDAPATTAPLTPRQRDCVVQVARGKSDWEAAAILGLSPDTVHQHIEEAKRRFKAPTRLQLVIQALARGAISFADVLPWAFPAKRS